ncbi:metallophosphoesterase, partial [Candidatus Micrarchaeota archaeon]|nr:metallophosphoesterase [Candidatus Micrarchaeota archaeon]MBU1930948.1 metallophosphoesterase [Candidatus Micrarchaeota archaeon]
MQKAQGSLEYLLIIGGGIIVAVVIIGSALFLTETGTEGTITGFAQGVCASHLGTDCYSQTFMIEDKEFACYLSDPNHCVAKSSDSIRFVQVTDTHLITGHTCEPNDPVDGRTDCYNNLVNYTDECSTGVCSWINPGTGMSIAPTIALQDAVEMVNEFNPDFVIVTGDLVAPSPCDTIKEESFALFKNIMNGLNTNYYVIGATSHDGVSNSICLEMFVDAFGENMKNWSFTRGKNLFIGLSETWETNNQLDLGYLELILNTYANQDMKVFIFFHTQISCYDEITGANFRCTNNPNLRTMLLAHQSEYKSVITIGG